MMRSEPFSSLCDFLIPSHRDISQPPSDGSAREIRGGCQNLTSSAAHAIVAVHPYILGHAQPTSALEEDAPRVPNRLYGAGAIWEIPLAEDALRMLDSAILWLPWHVIDVLAQHPGLSQKLGSDGRQPHDRDRLTLGIPCIPSGPFALTYVDCYRAELGCD